MSTNFTISNFKAFNKPQTIRIAPITLILGQNSVGKSSIIQSLLLLDQSFSNTDAKRYFELSPKGEYIDLGLPNTYFHKGNTNKYLQFGFVFDLSDYSFNSNEIDLFYEIYPKIEVILSYIQKNIV
jgi:AAA15 family ATPase/GTPase